MTTQDMIDEIVWHSDTWTREELSAFVRERLREELVYADELHVHKLWKSIIGGG